MPRVALVAHWDWVLYNYRLPLARGLRERGADVTFVSPPGKYVPGLRAAGFRWLPWPAVRRSLSPLTEMPALVRLRALYRRERFDAVQHFTIKPVLYGSIAARQSGVPTVINTFTGLGFLFSGSRTAACLRPLVLPVLRRLLHGPRVYTVLQNPRDHADFLRRRLVPPARTRVIRGSGVDTARFAPASNGERPTDAPVVLMASRLLQDKGVGEFVQAARALRGQGLPARFWVAGEPDRGSPTCIPDDALAAWQRDGSTEFLGHQDDMAAVLRQAAIAVLPTSYQEGVPRFLLEAAAAGLPLVGSDIEGCRMVIQPGVNGLLVPPKDAPALTDALARLLADDDLRARMGQASRAHVVEAFDEDRILAEYLALYEATGVLR
jgi:glycosyltransferase involved in cell wall biosynthesis